MTDRTYTSEGLDPQFGKDMLTKLVELFTPSEYDNPEGRRILGEEIDKALDEVKKKMEDEQTNNFQSQDAQRGRVGARRP